MSVLNKFLPVSVGLFTRTLVFILMALAVERYSTLHNIKFFFWIFLFTMCRANAKGTTNNTDVFAMLFQETKKWVSYEKFISLDVYGLLPPTLFTVSSIFTVCSRPKTHLRLSDKEPVALNFHTKLFFYILLSITNKMQRYAVNVLHVSGGFSAHHQELKNCTHSIWYMSCLLAATASVGELETARNM